MGFFVLKSEITIGSFQFSGVHETRVKRGLHHYADSALIKIPSIGMITVKNKASVNVITTGTLFQEGDAVTIKLGYETPFDKPGDNVLQEEFRGFVKRTNLNMPLEVECEGYVRQLRQKRNLNGFFKKTTAKDLLELACKGTDIKVVCTVDFPIAGIRLVNADGTQVIDHIKKCSCNALSIFFIEPDVLWCGLVYTPFLAGTNIFNLPTVNYRLGYNTVKDNGLKVRIPKEPVQVYINGKLASADAIRTESKDDTAERKVRFLLNNVPDTKAVQSFAQEVANNLNYTGYEGKINGFLQPFALPGYVANVEDARYGKRDGTYLIEDTEVIFGINGARRLSGIGVKLN